ncbi:MAG: hypothetical protein AB1938_27755 [Myxococcota bacterium]
MTPSSSRLLTIALGCLGLVACPDSPSKRTQEQLDALQKKKADAAKAAKEDKPAPLPTEVLRLDPPYDDTQAVVITPDGPCPEGFWALFPGDVPGATPEEKKANAANKKALAEAARSKKYLIRLKGAGFVTLSPYDAPKGRFTIDVKGTIDCTDSMGRVAIAWTDAKAGDPGASAAKEGAEVTQNVWMAPPVTFELPITSLAEAKAFNDQNRFGLSARVAFAPGKVEVDKKLKKMPKVTEKAAGETLTLGGGTEDWGAGRLLRVELLGIRVATDRDKKQLFDQRPSK